MRKRVGKGSFTSIKAIVEEWKDLQEQEKKVEAPEMPDPVVSAVNRLWTEAWKGAQQLFDGERLALNNDRLQMEEERREMSLEIDRLESELKTVSQQIDSTNQKLDSTRENARTLYTEKTRFEERLIAEEKKNADKEGVIQQLQAEIREVRQDAEKAGLDQYDEKEARVKAEKESVRLQENLKHVQEQGEKDRGRLEGQVKELEEQLSQAREAIRQEQESRKDAEGAAVELRLELARSQERTRLLEEQLLEERKKVSESTVK